MLSKEVETMLATEFDRQVENLVLKGYPKLAGVTTEAFMELIDPLNATVRELGMADNVYGEGHLSFVIVVKIDLIGIDQAMQLIVREGKPGVVNLHPVDPILFKPIDNVELPPSSVYVLVDIDRGEDTINIAPDEAMRLIQEKDRSPLTIDEGIAIITHYPDFLKKNHCFSLLASRCGDRRVPALWLSERRPKLGWCWAGNPHTWLGSASCGRRVGHIRRGQK
jgi:hypothetical protein